MRFLLFCCFLLFLPAGLFAQAIEGVVLDAGTGDAIENVAVQNVYTRQGLVTGGDGKFFITGREDELIEFRKIGYKITRIRVPRIIPPYFKIVLQRGEIELPEFELRRMARAKDYKTDSARYGELYKHVLDFPKMSAVESMRSPFSALSRSNRQKWAFQENYAWFQQEKYIDYVFNDAVVSGMTGFSGDTLQRFKQRFRPSYEQLRNMSEYNFYQYIKESAERFRRSFSRPRNAG